MSELRCRDLIRGELHDRIMEIRTNDLPEPLCIDVADWRDSDREPFGNKVYARVLLRWGGPQDEFRFYIDKKGVIQRGTYNYLDWFDGAERKLTSKQYVDVMDVWGVEILRAICEFKVFNNGRAT
jgi:hypothetical protein